MSVGRVRLPLDAALRHQSVCECVCWLIQQSNILVSDREYMQYRFLDDRHCLHCSCLDSCNSSVQDVPKLHSIDYITFE
jgi:hypothetical protein